MDAAAAAPAGHPGSLALAPGSEPGRREERSSGTAVAAVAAAAAAAAAGRAGGLRAECCSLQRTEKLTYTITQTGHVTSLPLAVFLSCFVLTGVLHPILLRLLLLWGTGLLRRVSTWGLVLLVHLTYYQKQERVQRLLLLCTVKRRSYLIRWQLQDVMQPDASHLTVQSCYANSCKRLRYKDC